MVKIIEKYSFNIPRGKTKYQKRRGGIGGLCPRECHQCFALELCGGCDFFCPDIRCPGIHCNSCACQCYRGGERLKKTIDFIGGLEIDLKKQKDQSFSFPKNIIYIPAINKPLKFITKYPVVSIPFYAIYDFEKEQPIIMNLRKYFNLSENTQIICNFYFKDDKIAYLFDLMLEGRFFSLIDLWKNQVNYWHTPCFSVFTRASGMDTLINFKRQFWIGDLMREYGLNVIQEALYSLRSKTKASIDDVIYIIRQKNIIKISQNCQLIYNFKEAFQQDLFFVKLLPYHIQWIQTGLSAQQAADYLRIRRKGMFFSNYTSQYSHRKNWEAYVNQINEDLQSIFIENFSNK